MTKPMSLKLSVKGYQIKIVSMRYSDRMNNITFKVQNNIYLSVLVKNGNTGYIREVYFIESFGITQPY